MTEATGAEGQNVTRLCNYHNQYLIANLIRISLIWRIDYNFW